MNAHIIADICVAVAADDKEIYHHMRLSPFM
jgi:hypothetical protein